MKNKIFDIIVPITLGDFMPSATFLRGENRSGAFHMTFYRNITESSYQRALRVAEKLWSPSACAASLGKIRSERKAKSSAENGKKGGRPPKRNICICPVTNGRLYPVVDCPIHNSPLREYSVEIVSK